MNTTWKVYTSANEETADKLQTLKAKWLSTELDKMWKKESSVWTGTDESNWLGWLNSPIDNKAILPRLEKLTADIKARGIQDVILLGMGGSALGARCIQNLAVVDQGAAKLHVLDSTFPDDVAAVEKKINIKKSIFIVSSKSGGTLETRLMLDHFWALCPDPKHFIAVTDKNSGLEKLAEERGFADIFIGDSAIGGRYSVFSPFGLVPLAAAGFDCSFILDVASTAREACQSHQNNPGLDLGIALGLGVRDGQNLVYVEGLQGFATAVKPWTDQLFAESTGKDGKGILPIDFLPSLTEGSSQVLHLHCSTAFNPEDIKQTDTPFSIVLDTEGTAGFIGALYIFEFATAVAGSIIGIHPFDQPNVESAKVACRKIMENKGDASFPDAALVNSGISFFLSNKIAKDLKGQELTIDGLKKLISQGVDNFQAMGLLFWAAQTPANIQVGKATALMVADDCDHPVMLAYGPGFLHSVGQAYKGAADDVLYIQVVEACDPQSDLSKAVYAQGWGDFEAMSTIGRSVLRCEVSGNFVDGVKKLFNLLKKNPA